MKIVVCDDDALVYEQMKNIIASYSIVKNENLELTFYQTVEELLHAKHKYDILFLDIRFNNCDIGIDVAKKLRKAGNTSLIILLTSLHSKAIEGYEIGAYRYIVKPIIKEKMYAVLDEAISSIRSNYRVILVKDMYNTVVVKIQQILYIYSNARKRCLVTLDGEIETWEQLKSIYEKLPQEQFAYAQKGFVVNYKMIKKLNKTGVELVNGENVPISRGMKNEFFANYFEFLGYNKMIDASIALLKCVIDYGLCIWAFSWFAKRKSENRALFLGSIFLSSLFLFGINMLEIPWLNTIVSAFTLLVLFLVVFYTRWQQALPLALILVTLCVICEFTPPLIMSALIGNNLAQTIEITIDAAAFNLIASGIFYIVLRVGRFILNRIYGEKTPIYTKNNGWASIFPIVSIVFVYYIVYMGAVANTSQTTMMGGILYAFILISNICFFLGEVATEKRYLTAEEYKQMMFEQEKTEAVMNLQEQHLKEMKGLIHDFEAQLNGLQLLARENKSEAFKKSIEEVRESIQERNDFYFVESKALQLILNQTNELCIKYGIEFCADIRYGNFLFMTFPDVFSLFENALCNAVNACLQLGEEEKKRIELRVFRQHEQIVVLLANTYNKANTRSNTYALHPHHEHGYGIQNIKRVIRKYNGTYLVKKEDVYKLMISFPLDVGNVKI